MARTLAERGQSQGHKLHYSLFWAKRRGHFGGASEEEEGLWSGASGTSFGIHGSGGWGKGLFFGGGVVAVALHGPKGKMGH